MRFGSPSKEIHAFTRTFDEEWLLIVLDFSAGEPTFDLLREVGSRLPRLRISNYGLRASENLRTFALRPYEARVYG